MLKVVYNNFRSRNRCYETLVFSRKLGNVGYWQPCSSGGHVCYSSLLTFDVDDSPSAGTRRKILIMAQVKVSGAFTRRWKGKLCSEKQYEKYIRMSAVGSARKLRAISPEPPEPDLATPRRRPPTPAPTHPEEENIAPSVEPLPDFARGRRIVEIPVLAKYLWCGQCKECLSLENIIGESRRGLGSVFNVRCHKCCLINQVPTGKLHPDAAGRLTCFDVNAKAVLGTVDSGCAFKQVAQLFATMNMPGMDFKTFKKYEERIGPHLEAVAKDSCREAAEKERALTLKNVEALQKML